MTWWVKLIMIVLTIISFSSGIVNFMAMFVAFHPQIYFMMSILSFAVSHAINQEILMTEEIQEEYDETF
jgi:hypothetical protein